MCSYCLLGCDFTVAVATSRRRLVQLVPGLTQVTTAQWSIETAGSRMLNFQAVLQVPRQLAQHPGFAGIRLAFLQRDNIFVDALPNLDVGTRYEGGFSFPLSFVTVLFLLSLLLWLDLVSAAGV